MLQLPGIDAIDDTIDLIFGTIADHTSGMFTDVTNGVNVDVASLSRNI